MSGPARNVIEGQIDALATVIGQIASVDGDHQTAVPELTLYRRSKPTDPLHCIYNVGLGIVPQGEKHVLVGRDSWNYGPGKPMLTSIDLPVVFAP